MTIPEVTIPEREPTPPKIEEWPAADYRWRIIIGKRDLGNIMVALGELLDYPNFKSRIASLPDQCHKLDGYHDLWAAGYEWQRDDPAKSVPGSKPDDLVLTSADDLKSTLHHVTDVPRLRKALDWCEREGMKTKAKLLTARIKQLER